MPIPILLTSTKSPARLRPAARRTASIGVRVSLLPTHTACAMLATTTAWLRLGLGIGLGLG